MKFLEPVVPEKIAWRRLHRRRFDRVRRLIRSSARLWRNDNGETQAAQPGRTRGRLPYVEVVWIPSYRVQFEVLRGDAVVKIETLVGGNERTFSVWNFSDARWRTSAGGDHFSATIDDREARAIAQQGLSESLLRRRGWGCKLTVLAGGTDRAGSIPLLGVLFRAKR